MLGAGRAGTMVAGALVAAGAEVVGLWSRSRPETAEAAEGPDSMSPPLPGPRQVPSGTSSPPRLHGPSLPDPSAATVVVLAVSDGAIGEVGARLAAAGVEPGTVVLHLSGALAGRAAWPGPGPVPGVHYGSWHPLQALPGTGAWPAPFCFAVEGDPRAVEVGRRLAEAVGCRAVELPAEGKALYHAAAVLASNLLVALEAVAVRTVRRAGVPAGEAWALLGPLVRGTVDNLDRLAPEGALTGPIARGDAGVVARHVAALAEVDPRAAAVYLALSREAVDLVRDRLPEDARRALHRALDPDCP